MVGEWGNQVLFSVQQWINKEQQRYYKANNAKNEYYLSNNKLHVPSILQMDFLLESRRPSDATNIWSFGLLRPFRGNSHPSSPWFRKCMDKARVGRHGTIYHLPLRVVEIRTKIEPRPINITLLVRTCQARYSITTIPHGYWSFLRLISHALCVLNWRCAIHDGIAICHSIGSTALEPFVMQHLHLRLWDRNDAPGFLILRHIRPGKAFWLLVMRQCSADLEPQPRGDMAEFVGSKIVASLLDSSTFRSLTSTNTYTSDSYIARLPSFVSSLTRSPVSAVAGMGTEPSGSPLKSWETLTCKKPRRSSSSFL